MKIFKQLAILSVTALLCGGVPAGPLDGISETGAKFEKESNISSDSLRVFTADKNEYQTSILFSPPAVLKNFKVLLLTFKDYTDAGAIFDQEEIYSAGDVSAEKPLLVKLTFIGSIPNYGISYEDNSGADTCSFCSGRLQSAFCGRPARVRPNKKLLNQKTHDVIEKD